MGFAGPGNDGRTSGAAHHAYSPAVLGSTAAAPDKECGESNSAAVARCTAVSSDMAGSIAAGKAVGQRPSEAGAGAVCSSFCQAPTPSLPVVPRSSSGVTVTGAAPGFARTRT